MFQDHHVLPKKFADHPVIRLLGKRFNIDGVRNLVTLPSRQPLATELGSSPHTGGHLGTYHDGFFERLENLKVSPKFDLADAGDERALDEIASEVNALVAAAKYAVANGHLLPNTPEGLTTEEGNGKNREWFQNRGTYAADQAEQIRQMQETVDQLRDAGQRDAALAFPLLSPTSGLSMAERNEILRRSGKGTISLHFTGVDPIPDAPGLVPSLIDTRLRGLSPPDRPDLNENEGFTPSDPRFRSVLPAFPSLSPEEQRLGELPPTTAAPSDPLVLLSDPHSGMANPYYDNPLAGGTPVVRNALPWMAGGAAVGLAAPSLLPWLLGIGGILAVTRAANAQEGSGATMGASTPRGGVFSTGAPAHTTSNNGLSVDNAASTRGVLASTFRPQLSGASSLDPEAPAGTLADRFGEWVAAPAGTMPAKDPPAVPTSTAASVAPEDVRRLARVNETNAGNVFTTGTAPVPYLPSTEFDGRFGFWTAPTAGGQQPQPSKPIGVFADEPSYLIPPPIFGVDGSVNPRNDGEEWFSRWIRPLLPPE
ncbi:AHH domain-containing protein [Bradyrhizobium liaoningense]|uniref:AHH domain-containing protein n=1 Tax=Bradyrhizobium liaoningense TaxID=43992 RepID=UPI001BA73E2A|nr:AHH domain-containing protein [Bradyrhizobium liaoningense]MBR1167304.1 AHH domain-containing protein [Bradyrhizobium liaoningense]